MASVVSEVFVRLLPEIGVCGSTDQPIELGERHFVGLFVRDDGLELAVCRHQIGRGRVIDGVIALGLGGIERNALYIDGKALLDTRQLFGRARQPDDRRVEQLDIFADAFAGVVLRIDRDEHDGELHAIRAQFLPEPCHAGQIGGADIRAAREAEEDGIGLAGQSFVADKRTIGCSQFERAAKAGSHVGRPIMWTVPQPGDQPHAANQCDCDPEERPQRNEPARRGGFSVRHDASPLELLCSRPVPQTAP